MCLFGAAVGTCVTVLVILLLIYVLPMHFIHPLPSGRVEGTDIIAIKNRINNLFFYYVRRVVFLIMEVKAMEYRLAKSEDASELIHDEISLEIEEYYNILGQNWKCIEMEAKAWQ